jgi:hypothetical protein
MAESKLDRARHLLAKIEKARADAISKGLRGAAVLYDEEIQIAENTIARLEREES